MDERSYRRLAATDNRNRRPGDRSLGARPDRLALWAVAMALVAMIAAAASAQAQGQGDGSGGVGTGGGGGGDVSASGCLNYEFGSRTLALGDCGDDVTTLNWILNSTGYGTSAPMSAEFAGTTESSVQRFQEKSGLAPDGVVNNRTRQTLVRTMSKRKATWYGPGFFGSKTACGKTLRRSTLGVAHKRLPCGTKVVVRYKGTYVRTKVIDRGPYAYGAKWDLTRKTARTLGFEVTDKVRVAKIKKAT
jgi:peptidoglycan hydrolase-like protein with peptidoglycan-binding domain